MLSTSERAQIEKVGISESDIKKQLLNFRNGIKPILLIKAAAIKDGISHFEKEKEEELIQLYRRFKDSLDVVKFVPASGAATRMFKYLFEGLDVIENGGDFSEHLISFITQIKEYPFYKQLSQVSVNEGLAINLESFSENPLKQKSKIKKVLEAILYDKDNGLDYARLPKALIVFHNENDTIKTALEEHFLECVSYANSDGKGRIHFTVSKEHLKAIKSAANNISKKYKEKLSFKIEYSIQKESTKTIAVYKNLEPVKTEDSSLMLRPSGHGALLENLNDIDAQLIFIKNIDNVSASKWHVENAKYKELIAGRLLDMRENIHNLLNGLIHQSGMKRASDVIFNRWGIRVNTEKEIKYILDRPLRVCGMVKNTGEPGGGPFWVNMPDGSKGRQIVESSQIDMSNKEQVEIWKSSTHFNPVDLVCWVENHSGEKFDLMKYRDDNTGFISNKSYQGKDIKIQELPGLWNGGMTGWITEFVEVPLRTFNPVKTVSDLMKEGHRS